MKADGFPCSITAHTHTHTQRERERDQALSHSRGKFRCLRFREIETIYFRISIVILQNYKLLEPKRGFPGDSEGKVPACSAGDLGSIPGSGRSSGEGHGNPLRYSCMENPMDGETWYIPWGHRESDTTEWLHFRAVKRVTLHAPWWLN